VRRVCHDFMKPQCMQQPSSSSCVAPRVAGQKLYVLSLDSLESAGAELVLVGSGVRWQGSRAVSEPSAAFSAAAAAALALRPAVAGRSLLGVNPTSASMLLI